MINQRFTKLLAKKLSDEISSDENQEFLSVISEDENLRREYELLSEYFEQKEEPYTGSASLFQKIRNRIDSEK